MTSSLFSQFPLLVSLLAAPLLASAQSFEETWLEFIQERKVVRISALTKPDKGNDAQDYAKYLLMNANSRFCSSRQDDAERLTAELVDMGPEVYTAVPGFAERLTYIQDGYQAYYAVDSLWQVFRQGEPPSVEYLESVEEVNRVCEKGTMAKYSYMLAYANFCDGDLEAAQDIFENRTLRLAQATSWKISDVDGLAAPVKKMERLFAAMPRLDAAWEKYLDTGDSPGYDVELPVVGCFVEPNLKAAVLKGAADICGDGPAALQTIDKLLPKGSPAIDYDLEKQILALQEAVGSTEGNLANLNEAWDYFLANGKVNTQLAYTYDYCENEPLVRAYLLDGYTFVCSFAESALEQIDSLRRTSRLNLTPATKQKIDELSGLRQEYLDNGANIEEVWSFFVVNDDQLVGEYESTDEYCDNIQYIKDWTIRGLTASCNDKVAYLEQIDKFMARLEFKLYPELECRVQKLRIQIWDCKHAMLQELAEAESAAGTATVSTGEVQSRLQELMTEYAMPERPEECVEE